MFVNKKKSIYTISCLFIIILCTTIIYKIPDIQTVSKRNGIKEQFSTNMPNKSEIKKLLKSLQPVDYTILANGKNGLSISADTAILRGFFYSNNDIVINGSNIKEASAYVSGNQVLINSSSPISVTKLEHCAEFKLPNWLKSFQRNSENYQKYTSAEIKKDSVFLQQNSIYTDYINIYSSSITFDTKLIVKNNITINTSQADTKNSSIIISESGNIEIYMDNLDYKGLLYAPNGAVTIHGKKLNFNGKIIAEHIKLNADSIVIEDNLPLDEMGLTYPVDEKELEKMKKNFNIKDNEEQTTEYFFY